MIKIDQNVTKIVEIFIKITLNILKTVKKS